MTEPPSDETRAERMSTPERSRATATRCSSPIASSRASRDVEQRSCRRGCANRRPPVACGLRTAPSGCCLDRLSVPADGDRGGYQQDAEAPGEGLENVGGCGSAYDECSNGVRGDGNGLVGGKGL